jgi:hypothetical protein
MQRRLEQFERRLARIAAALRVWKRDPERERRAREERDTLAAILRAGLKCAGVDPNEVWALRHLETWEPPGWMRPRQFVHPLRRIAERQRPRSLLERLDEDSKRYQGPPAPDLSQASVIHLIGYYCFGAGAAPAAAREAPA